MNYALTMLLLLSAAISAQAADGSLLQGATSSPDTTEIHFHSAHRGILSSFTLTFPRGMKAEWQGILVDVIGRGLVNLAHQGGSIRECEGQHVLTLENLDLRPDNGIDLCFIILSSFPMDGIPGT